MQSKSANYLLLVIITLAVLGLLYWQTIPKTKPVAKVVVYGSDILDSDVVKSIKNRKSYGNLPVTVGTGEAGKTDPFSGP